jgi:hypothetical protein
MEPMAPPTLGRPVRRGVSEVAVLRSLRSEVGRSVTPAVKGAVSSARKMVSREGFRSVLIAADSDTVVVVGRNSQSVVKLRLKRRRDLKRLDAMDWTGNE